MWVLFCCQFCGILFIFENLAIFENYKPDGRVPDIAMAKMQHSKVKNCAPFLTMAHSFFVQLIYNMKQFGASYQWHPFFSHFPSAIVQSLFSNGFKPVWDAFQDIAAQPHGILDLQCVKTAAQSIREVRDCIPHSLQHSGHVAQQIPKERCV